jgi:DNA-binding IscR family transcriptional regulator
MPHRCEAALERAARLGWTARTVRDSWLLARDADTISVADIYRSFAFDAQTWSFDEADRNRTLRDYAKDKKE